MFLKNFNYEQGTVNIYVMNTVKEQANCKLLVLVHDQAVVYHKRKEENKGTNREKMERDSGRIEISSNNYHHL